MNKLFVVLAVAVFATVAYGCAPPKSLSREIWEAQVEAAKKCKPGHSCMGDVLQGKMQTPATQDAYDKAYRHGDAEATKEVAGVAECVARNRARIDHGLRPNRDCSALAARETASEVSGVGIGSADYRLYNRRYYRDKYLYNSGRHYHGVGGRYHRHFYQHRARHYRRGIYYYE